MHARGKSSPHACVEVMRANVHAQDRVFEVGSARLGRRASYFAICSANLAQLGQGEGSLVSFVEAAIANIHACSA